MKKRFAPGFTLIEILIAILLVGILIAAALPRYVELTQQAEMTTMKKTLEVVSRAQYIHYMHTGTFYNGGGIARG